MKSKFILCLALVLSGCTTNRHSVVQRAVSTGPGIYVVQPGDSETAIAKKLCVTMQQLSDFNPGIDWSHLKIGQKLDYVGQASAPRPVIYHNTKYDFTFSLPSYWEGYSVLNTQWEGISYFPDKDGPVVTERGPMIILRHPFWTTNAPRQDIPIMVFTCNQWDKLWQTNGFSVSAGGVEEEIEHNARYVFVTNSRFNWGELPGWEEAGRIVDENRDANKPHLREE